MAIEIVELLDEATGATARVLVGLGLNCFGWRPVLGDGPREMLWTEPGFENGDKRPSGSGLPLLFPFLGRIGGAAYTFAGREYRLDPGDAFGNAIHGFVYNRSWRVVESDGPRVVGEFRASVDDPMILDQWPADFLIRVEHEIRGRALITNVRYENCGDGPLPCGFGTHAYFRLPLAEGAAVEETRVQVPVGEYWELERMVPTGRRLPVAGELDLASGEPLGGREFDTVLTKVCPDGDGLVRTRLTEPASGRVLTQTVDPAFTQCVVYTPGHREAICLEPCTCVPDAIHLAPKGHDTGLQILQPGESFETTLRIEVEG